MWHTYILTVLMVVFGTLTLSAQSRLALKGAVQDSSAQPIVGATVVLLGTEDSVLQSFAMSDAQGSFHLKKLSPGTYLFQVSFLGFEKYSTRLEIAEAPALLELGVIELEPEVRTLDAVEIEGERTPIKFNKDTLEYNADAFQTQPNAVVEDLLKKLPGVEVERDGTIKAMGETVQKVLVDGKEFFGNDLQMATKNLPADAVKKVQVFDRKSDFATFTGVDDGQEAKTINLSLKEEKKKGAFGRITGGYGNKERYSGRLNVNRFRKKNQLSLIAMGNNTNEQGFSVMEYINFMGGMQSLMSRSGQVRIDGSDLGIPLGEGRADGFMASHAGGMNLNLQPKKGSKFNLSYMLSHIDTERDLTRMRQNFLNQGLFLSETQQRQDRSSLGHSLNMSWEQKWDSTQQFILRANANYRDGENQNRGSSETFNAEAALENDTQKDNSANADRLGVDLNTTYRKRFKKKGRALVLEGDLSMQDDARASNVRSLNRFNLDFPAETFSQEINQRQSQDNEELNYGFKLTYLEPIGKGKNIGISYEHSNYGTDLSKEFFDIFPQASPREVFNTDLSIRYNTDYLFDNVGVNFRWKARKSNLRLGLNAQESRLKGELISLEQNIKNRVFNLLPSARFRYDFSRSRNLSIRYRTQVEQPTVEQLQPVLDNSDPLNLYIGNPDLRPEYQHDLRTRFFSFSQFSMTSIFANLGVTYTHNKITNVQRIDSLLRRETQPINVDYDWRIRANASFSTRIKPINARISFDSRIVYNRNILFINEAQNIANRWSLSNGLTLENRNKDVWDIVVGGKLTLNNTFYSEAEDLDQKLLNQEYFVEFARQFGKRWRVSSTFTYFLYGGNAFDEAQEISLWEASFSHYFMENQRAELKLSAFDLLNQNQGVSRRSDANFIQEQRVRSLAQFFMLSFSYNLSKFGNSEGNGGITIRQRR